MIGFIGESRMTESSQNTEFHRPVMLRETVDLLRPAEGKIFFDGTVGGGGHSAAMLEAGAEVVACDRDPSAIAAAARRLFAFGERVRFVETNYAEASAWFPSLGVSAFNGILLDLGASSHQFAAAERGFSIQKDGPLDMRMSPDSGEPTAADLLNEMPEADLRRIISDLGEERQARRIARHLVKIRIRQRFRTTGELARAIERILPRRGPRHPATRVFQALRMAVNRELENLERALPALGRWVKPGGRFAVITFHSLEDRIVKNYFRSVSRLWVDRPEWPEARRNPDYAFRLCMTRPFEPAVQELKENPRARSAKLRAVERNQI
jgi:16S rRNA (cytosine1402-N4)-methyltransferase